MEPKILAVLARKNYVPVKPKALARKLGLTDAQYPQFRQALKALVQQGKAQFGKNHTVRPGGAAPNTVTGVFRRLASGRGFVRLPTLAGQVIAAEVAVAQEDSLDAATGDEVLVKITRPARGDESA